MEIQMRFEKMELSLELEIKLENGIGFENLESKMELDLKSGIQDGIGFEIWNPRWNWIRNLES